MEFFLIIPMSRHFLSFQLNEKYIPFYYPNQGYIIGILGPYPSTKNHNFFYRNPNLIGRKNANVALAFSKSIEDIYISSPHDI